MHIEQLIYFLHVAETGSISAVAQSHYMSQQAISASLKNLESELDTLLINRNNKGITLTPEGYFFYDYAKKLVQQYNEAIYELARYRTENHKLYGRLSILSASIFTETFLLDLLRDFTNLFPNVDIKLIETDSAELLPHMYRQIGDIAFFSATDSYVQNALTASKKDEIGLIPLISDKFVICVRPDHPLARYKTVDETFMAEFIEKNDTKISLYQALSDKFFTMNVSDVTISKSSNPQLHKKLIMEGLAITYMPELAYLDEFKKEGYTAVKISNASAISHCILYQNNPLDEKYTLIQTFTEFAQKKFQNRFKTKTPPSVNTN